MFLLVTMCCSNKTCYRAKKRWRFTFDGGADAASFACFTFPSLALDRPIERTPCQSTAARSTQRVAIRQSMLPHTLQLRSVNTMFTGSGGTSTGWCLLCCGAECYGAVWRQMRGGEQNNTRKVRVGRAMSGGKSRGRSLTRMLEVVMARNCARREHGSGFAREE